MGGTQSKVEIKPPLLDEPWRKSEFPFTKEGCNSLRESLKECGLKDSKETANILLLGHVGAGKSAFVNSVLGMSCGRIVQTTCVGNETHSVTTMHGVHEDYGVLRNFVFHDCMGIEAGEQAGFNTGDVDSLIRGEMPRNYKFNPAATFKAGPSQQINDWRTHCVIFFFDASKFDYLSNERMQKMIKLRKSAKKHEVPIVVCLTHIDLLCKEVNNDLRKTFENRKVSDVVKRVSERFGGTPISYIHPIKNYECELENDITVDMLLMFPLRAALHFASDYLHGHRVREDSRGDM